MSVSNRQPSRSFDLGRHRRQIAAAKKTRRPRARKAFFEALEGRAMMAFTPGDVFATSFGGSNGMYNITPGGDLSALSPLATVGSAASGQIAWSGDLNTAYVTSGNTVLAVTSTGGVTTFASGLSEARGLVWTDDNRLLVAERNSGEVTDITAGGDFTTATPFASGLNLPRGMIRLSDGRILVAEEAGEVTELGTGGDLSAATPFATGLPEARDIVQSSSGAIFVTSRPTNRVVNITAGGNFSADAGFATGIQFIGLTYDALGRLLASESGGDRIYDISAGGAITAANTFATMPPSYTGSASLDTVPLAAGTLTPALTGGNLVITDTDAIGKNNSLTISHNGLVGPLAAIVITDANEAFSSTGGITGAMLSNGGKTLTVPLTSITGTDIIINGMAGNDTLTASLANALGKLLTFNGGDPSTAPGDKLVISGGTFTTVSLNHTNGNSGSVVAGANTINYTGLEPVDLTGSTITDLVINLPDVAGTPDDTELSFDNGTNTLTVKSLSGVPTHESHAIAMATITNVTVNGRAGDDKITLDSTMSTFNKPLTLNGGNGNDTTIFEASLTAPGAIMVNGGTGTDALDYSGYQVAAVDTAVDVTLTATAANGFSGNVKVAASTITSFTEIDSVTGNSNTTTDSLTGLAAGTWTIDESTTSKYVSGGTLNFAKLEKLNGGTGNDDFVVTNTAAVAFTLAGGGGTNSLNLSAVAGANVELTSVDAGGADGTETTKTITFSDIKTLTGDGTSTLKGTNDSKTWVIDDAATNTYATDLSFKGFQTLTGGDGLDTFEVRNNTAVSYTLNGGKGLDHFNFGSVANKLDSIANITVNGDTDGADLTLRDQGNSTNINYSVAAGTIGRTGGGTVSHTGTANLLLTGTTGNNKFSVTAVPNASGTKTLSASTGIDTLDLTGFGVSSVTVTEDGTPNGFNGTFSGVAFQSIDSFQGVNGSTFTGDDAISTWNIIDGSTSTYATAARTANISGFNNLQGGSAKDTFNVVNNSTTTNYSLKGGDGLDAFNFGSANKLDGITNPISVDGEGALPADRATLTLNDQGNMTPFNYAVDTLPVNITTISRVGGGLVTYDDITDLTLNASNGSNIMTVSDMPGATGVTTLNGGSGDDTLEVVDVNPVTVSKLAFAATATGFNGTVTSGTSFDFTGVEAIAAKQGTPADTLIGMDAASTWTVDESLGNTSKYVNNSALARVLRFSGFDKLQGQSFVDTFNVLNNSQTATFSLLGGGSLDAFNFGNGNNLDGITNPIGVDGEAASATLTLNDQGHSNPINYTLDKDVLNNGTIGRTLGGTVTYDDITALTLNASNGTNKITVASMPTAVGPIALNGGTGADTLDLTAAALNPVKVTLTAATLPLMTATGFDGKVESGGKSFNFTAVETIDARNGVDPNGLGDELIGININATWTINDATTSTYLADLAAPNPDRNLNFAGFETLTGNAGKDTFKVQNNSTSNPLTLDGQGGADTFIIADGGNKLRTTIKSLTVAGGTDAGDELILNDQDEAADKNYSISPTSVAVLEANGVVVNHSFVEKLTLNASDGGNLISVLDSNPTNTNYTVSPGGTTTTIKLLDTTGDAKVRINDVDDNANNNWTVTATTVTRTAPTPLLIVDYSGLALNSSLALAGGAATDTVAIEATDTGTTTTISGNGGNDVFTVAKGDLDASIKGPLTVEGGANLAATRTVFRGGLAPTATQFTFTPSSFNEAIGDTLTINDSLEAGLTKYAINSTSVSRTGAPQPINHKEIEFLKLQAGSGASDITATMPLPAAVQLPTIVQVDGGGNPLTTDNRFQIKGSTGADAITIGDATTVETNRSQFEVTNVTRMWVEGNVGNDVIHNRTVSVPALLDGGRAKDATTTPALANSAVTNEDDVIISDAQSTQNDYSSVLLGNDGKDFLLTKNNNTNGATGMNLPRLTSFLIGDYFINTNVKFSKTSAPAVPATARLQVVNNPLLPQTTTTAGVRMRSGESGDRYVTQHTPVTASRNRAIVRLDDAPNTYGPGKFENLSVDITNLQVIQWLQGRLRITVTPVGIANELAFANFYIRQFMREPLSAAAPAFPNTTYTPLGANATPATNANFPENGGEFIDGAEAEPPRTVQNPFDAADVNGDGRITAFDALIVINELNLKGPHLLNTSSTAVTDDGEAETSHFLDVTGDSAVTAFDALLVINRLNLGDTQIRNEDALGNAFAEIDIAEVAANEAFARELAANAPADSLSDDALLALLAADADDGDDSEEVFTF